MERLQIAAPLDEGIVAGEIHARDRWSEMQRQCAPVVDRQTHIHQIAGVAHEDPSSAARRTNDIFVKDVNGFIQRMEKRERDSRITGGRANWWTIACAIAAAFLASVAAIVSGLVALDQDQGLFDSAVLATILSASAALAAAVPASGKLAERARFHYQTEQLSRRCGSRAQTLRSRVQDGTLEVERAWDEFTKLQDECQELPDLP